MSDDRDYILVETNNYTICGWYRSIEEAKRNMGWPYNASKLGSYKIYHTKEVARGKASVTWENG